MRKILYSVSLALSVFLVGACNDLLDANSDPGRVGVDEATIATLLPSAQRFTANTQYGAAQYGAQYPQYLTGQAIGQFTPYGFDQLWQPFYTDAFPTLQDIITRAEPLGAYNYSGIAKTLLALNLMTVADIFGDAPYSQALQGVANLYPCYDKMEDLYRVHIIKLLDEALADLAKPLPARPDLRTVQNDLIYKGDLAQWTKAVHAIRARYFLHLSEKDPAALATAAQEAAMSFTSNTDDLQLVYEEQNPNPWFGFLGNATNKPMQPSSYVVDLLSGRGGRFQGVTDPRLPIYMTRSGTNTTYTGLTPGRLIGEPSANVNMTPTSWHTRAVAPILFITYAEIQFIIAEALFNTNREEAYAAYLRGIEASMRKVGTSEAEITAYVTNPAVALGSATFTLQDIMLQKYLALYMQMETWTDMRRYQYDPNVYVGLQKPVINQLPGNPWVQRSNLADEEPGVNTCLPEGVTQTGVLWLFQ
ncbi:SusD/RagB family nutrient-binding outer membrane lipoprotein [Rufibacter latericius]|uniref:SusD/RagB family nutrient-binding outer membrane lipoprotein n=1 Tax=Rufibacter latericius TaxID=2487040 RepID=A0A3M9MCX9_9BACT|nr:SusD/RagB family nutrient-binding outer membrane lipoprotein [Rufibacter latericius]RNI23430.1 SusD/RagB family nutrient-binding outer membrane lipoprotein [Rufibacter latericius]